MTFVLGGWTKASGTVPALWSAAFHDKVLRGDAELLGMARYLMGNPVRAGLAANVGAYPYWHGATDTNLG